MECKLYQHYKDNVIAALREKRGYANIHQVPRIAKVVLNTCVGSDSEGKSTLDIARNELAMITGQTPVETRAKQSISNFKLRKGQPLGAKVTLRGVRMYEFLERLITAALPRIRDFRAISTKVFDRQGNYTMGVKDQSIFPEIELDKISRNIGFDICIVTTAKSDAEAKLLLEEMGFPFADREKQTAAAA